MKEAWIVDRTRLRDLLKEHPEWPTERLAEETGRSTSWVKKWYRRIRQVAPDKEEEMLRGLSCIPDHPPPAIAPEVVAQILEIRFHPPPGLNRIPGPLTILYYLHQDEALQASGVHLPTSTSTVWKILKEHGCLPRKQPVDHLTITRWNAPNR